MLHCPFADRERERGSELTVEREGHTELALLLEEERVVFFRLAFFFFGEEEKKIEEKKSFESTWQTLSRSLLFLLFH